MHSPCRLVRVGSPKVEGRLDQPTLRARQTPGKRAVFQSGNLFVAHPGRKRDRLTLFFPPLVLPYFNRSGPGALAPTQTRNAPGAFPKWPIPLNSYFRPDWPEQKRKKNGQCGAPPPPVRRKAGENSGITEYRHNPGSRPHRNQQDTMPTLSTH
jgi:hypothetical protein